MTELSEKETLAAEYVLGLLSRNEIAKVIRLARDDGEFLQFINKWRELVSVIDNSVTPQNPPQLIWNNIRRQIAPKRSRTPLALAASFLLLAFAFMFSQLNSSAMQFGNEWQVALQNKETLMIKAMNPSPMPAGNYCVLWAKKSDGNIVKVSKLPMKNSLSVNINQGLSNEFKQGTKVFITMENSDYETLKPDIGKLMYMEKFRI